VLLNSETNQLPERKYPFPKGILVRKDILHGPKKGRSARFQKETNSQEGI